MAVSAQEEAVEGVVRRPRQDNSIALDRSTSAHCFTASASHRSLNTAHGKSRRKIRILTFNPSLSTFIHSFATFLHCQRPTTGSLYWMVVSQFSPELIVLLDNRTAFSIRTIAYLLTGFASCKTWHFTSRSWKPGISWEVLEILEFNGWEVHEFSKTWNIMSSPWNIENLEYCIMSSPWKIENLEYHEYTWKT